MQQIAKQCCDCQRGPQQIQPDGLAYRSIPTSIAKSQLEQNGGKSNCGDDHYRKRAKKCGSVGEKHHDSENSAEQAGCNHRPAATLDGSGRHSLGFIDLYSGLSGDSNELKTDGRDGRAPVLHCLGAN